MVTNCGRVRRRRRAFDQLLAKTVVRSSLGRVQDYIVHLSGVLGSERGDDVVEFGF